MKIIKKIIKFFKLIKYKSENLYDKFLAFVFKLILNKYSISFYFEDKFGFITKRDSSENFTRMFLTKESSDAFKMMAYLNNIIKKANISVDAGANIGITSIWMSKFSKKVYSFEPIKENIDRMKINLSLNQVKNVKIIPNALSDKNKTVKIFLSNQNGQHSLADNKISKIIGNRKIKSITIDNFCKKNDIKSIDFLKIDVEGFEDLVIEGAKNLIQKNKIKIIAFEQSNKILNNLNKDIYSPFNFLKKYNYEVFNLNGNSIDRNYVKKIKHEDLFAIPKKYLKNNGIVSFK